MYDRPNLAELIDAARMHLESAVIPAVKEDRQLYFRTLVAINVLRIAERELELGPKHARAQWQRLNAVEGSDAPLPVAEADLRAGLAARHAALCDRIRAGAYDGPQSAALVDHLVASVVEQLEVANPRYLYKLVQEGQNPDLDAWNNRV